MDFIAVGYPSPLTTWGFSFLENAFRRIAPDVQVERLDRYDVTAVGEASRSGRLILSMFPNPDFAEASLKSGARSLIFADDLMESVKYVRGLHSLNTVAALRPVSAGLVLARPFAWSRHGLIVERDLKGSPSDILKVFLEHFGLHTSDDLAHTTCGEIRFEDLALSAKLRRDSRQHQELNDEDRLMVNQTLGGLREHLEKPNPGGITWPRQCFFLGDRPDSTAPVAIDVTGRARIIFYGPYLHLPRGSWKVRVMIGFSKDIHGMPFAVEVHSTDLLGKARIHAERGGIFELEFGIQVAAAHEPIEVRIMNEQGAIEGHMGLVGIDFKEWSAIPEDVSSAA
jgi:hypothetical protein